MPFDTAVPQFPTRRPEAPCSFPKRCPWDQSRFRPVTDRHTDPGTIPTRFHACRKNPMHLVSSLLPDGFDFGRCQKTTRIPPIHRRQLQNKTAMKYLPGRQIPIRLPLAIDIEILVAIDSPSPPHCLTLATTPDNRSN